MARLEKVMQLSPQQIEQLLTLFHKTMEKLLVQLKEAMATLSYEDIAPIAHTIKGSSANFRFEQCSYWAAQLEADALKKVGEKKLLKGYTHLLEAYKAIYASR